MAQDSAFWEGTTVGDAASTDVWSAPYSAVEFSNMFSKILGADKAKAYVVPGYANDVKITANSPAAMNVLVNTGAVFFRGRTYENTTQITLTIAAADPTNPRLDRIVLRASLDSSSGQTIRAAVLTGTPGATPALPALTQNATTYEIAIARVYVAAAAASIADTEVHDEREFLSTFNQINSSYLGENLIRNSEYMALSAQNPLSADTTVPPDYWDKVLTPASMARIASSTLSQPSQPRGGIMSFVSNVADEGMSQTITIKKSTTYCIKVLTACQNKANYAEIKVTTNSASPNTVTKYEKRTNLATDLYTHQIIYTTESDATTMTISLLSATNSGANVVYFGQCLVVEGYIAGPFREIHEYLPFTSTRIGDASWNLTAKSSGGTTLDLSASFGGLIMAGTIGLMVMLEAKDTGSAAGNPSLSLSGGGPYVQVYLQGVPNSDLRGNAGIVNITRANYPATALVATVLASGAAALSATILIGGIIT